MGNIVVDVHTTFLADQRESPYVTRYHKYCISYTVHTEQKRKQISLMAAQSYSTTFTDPTYVIVKLQ